MPQEEKKELMDCVQNEKEIQLQGHQEQVEEESYGSAGGLIADEHRMDSDWLELDTDRARFEKWTFVEILCIMGACGYC